MSDVQIDPLALLGLAFALIVLWGMYRIHRDRSTPYDLSDLVTTGNRYDLGKVGQLTALVATTWIVIHMELRSATVEWALTLYGLLWAGTQFGSLWARIKSGQRQPSATTETTIRSTETIVQPPLQQPPPPPPPPPG